MPWVRGLVALSTLYWGAMALVLPVVVWDSHTYNVARLLVTRQAGGLFGEYLWTGPRQVTFPWTFDALHYPFVLLGGWGVSMPSFLCFLGLLWIVFRLVREAHGEVAAWWSLAALYALPTLLYQATSTKNDVGVLFGVACWFYAYRQWRSSGSFVFVLWMCLALGFAAGAKTSGIPIAGLLSLYSAWQLRHRLPQFLRAGAALVGAMLLFGSVETYLNSRLHYGAWLGSKEFVAQHANADGVAGAIANAFRYVWGNQSVGLDAAHPKPPTAAFLADSARSFLEFVSLPNRGYAKGFSDANLAFLKDGGEAGSDYGPLGAIALLAGAAFLLLRRPRGYIFGLAAFGWANLWLTAYFVGWMPWNARFLLLTFVPCTLALVLAMVAEGRSRPAQLLLLLTIAYSVVIYPLHSLNRRPGDLVLAFTKRRTLEMRENSGLAVVIDAVERLSREQPAAVIYLAANGNSWIYRLLLLPNVRCAPFESAVRNPRILARATHVLFLDLPTDPALLPRLELLRSFGGQINLYRVLPPVP